VWQVNVVAGSGISVAVKGASDEDDDGAFDVSKIKGKLAKRPPKGVGHAKKEKTAKKAVDPKKAKKVSLSQPLDHPHYFAPLEISPTNLTVEV
jgi:hypothetical protein